MSLNDKNWLVQFVTFFPPKRISNRKDQEDGPVICPHIKSRSMTLRTINHDFCLIKPKICMNQEIKELLYH